MELCNYNPLAWKTGGLGIQDQSWQSLKPAWSKWDFSSPTSLKWKKKNENSGKGKKS